MPEPTTAQFPSEGAPAFPVETPVENTTTTPPVEEKTDTTPTPATGGEENPDVNKETKPDGENTNFAEHPRWIEREADWKDRFNKQEERHTTSLAELRKEFEEKIGAVQPQKTENAPTQIPSWFGGDEQQWVDFQEYNNQLLSNAKDSAKKEVTGELEKKTASEQKSIEDATTYMNEQILDIEGDKDLNPTGAKIDKNKLLKIVIDNDLVDSKGKWNYKAGYNIMKSQPAIPTTNDTEEKKKLAAATTEEAGAETKPPEVTTSAYFKKPGNRPW